MSDPDVLSLEEAREGFDHWPLERKRREYGECHHRTLSVDEETGRVTCKGCGEEVDPVQALLKIAHWFVRYQHDLQEIRDWRASNRRKSVDGELGQPLDGRRHLVETFSTGRLHTVAEISDEGARPECGTRAHTRAVDRNLSVPAARAVLRHAYGCTRCLGQLPEEAS